MSIINIDKRDVPVTARNGRTYLNSTTSSSSSTISGGGGTIITGTTNYIPKYNGTILTDSKLVDNGTTLNYNGGYVGIGVVAPVEKLEVNGNIYANKNGAVFSMGNGAGSFGTIGFNNTTNDVEIKQKYYTGGIKFYTNTTVPRLVVLSNGTTEFRNNTGVLVAVLDANGNLKVKGEITAFATI